MNFAVFFWIHIPVYRKFQLIHFHAAKMELFIFCIKLVFAICYIPILVFNFIPNEMQLIFWQLYRCWLMIAIERVHRNLFFTLYTTIGLFLCVAKGGCCSIACIFSSQLFLRLVRTGNIFSVRKTLIFRTMQHFRKQNHGKSEVMLSWWDEHFRSADVWMILIKLKHLCNENMI